MRTTQAEGFPQISIIMTAFNTARYVEEAIESVLAQGDGRNWELLFVDDGSADGTLGVAQGYAARHPGCITVLQHRGAKNQGISASRNLALKHARGPLLAFLDSDDVWLPAHLETLARVMEGHPGVGMVYAGAERWVDQTVTFDEAAARGAEWGSNYLPPMLPKGERFGVLPRGRLLEWFLRDESLVPCICSVMVRTAAARAVGGFCNSFRGLYDDQAFHARMIPHYDIYALDACVARYRQHPESCCGQVREAPKKGETERRRFRSFLRMEQCAMRVLDSESV